MCHCLDVEELTEVYLLADHYLINLPSFHAILLTSLQLFFLIFSLLVFLLLFLLPFFSHPLSHIFLPFPLSPLLSSCCLDVEKLTEVYLVFVCFLMSYFCLCNDIWTCIHMFKFDDCAASIVLVVEDMRSVSYFLSEGLYGTMCNYGFWIVYLVLSWRYKFEAVMPFEIYGKGLFSAQIHKVFLIEFTSF